MRAGRLGVVAFGALVIGLVPSPPRVLAAAVPQCAGQAVTLSGSGTIVGTPDRDVILGSSGGDTIYGRQSDDYICGGGGPDTIVAGSGDDKVYGQGSSDHLKGGIGRDRLNGGPGNDSMLGSAQNDLLDGGPGFDFLAGNGGVNALNGGTGDDQLVGGPDEDLLDGEAGEDVLVGAAGDDRLRGGLNADQLRAGGGTDIVFGGAGPDTLQGGAGDDFLNGGPDTDVCDGGLGSDTVRQCEQSADDGRVRATLSWTNQVDMDLHVTEPGGNRIFYGNPTSPTGGALDVDVQCRGNGGLENTVWGDTASPLSGTYTIWVDQFAQCGDGPAAWRVEAFVNGRSVLSRSGHGEGPTNLTFTVG